MSVSKQMPDLVAHDYGYIAVVKVVDDAQGTRQDLICAGLGGPPLCAWEIGGGNNLSINAAASRWLATPVGK